MKNNKQPKNQRLQKNTAKDKHKTLIELYNKGKVHYIIKHGIVNWGISTGIIFIILTTIFQGGFSLRKIIEGFSNPNNLWVIGGFGLGGIVWGSLMWKWVEKEANKIQQKKK
ncbi:hypothetical protein [Natronincola ferrireducens]|uniref:Uncharacterized protein n=1 Tax=Natronincola ferrireducens TaxID=393762 RepID=A0A1G9FFK6_9FIRM|nr:hypothetical protein [Natronincola ferrireducens]SDK87149.1 hypothetical protein SAMN05660472_02177 [Natronincola ferrireducens]